ncbi:hypothetical protein CBF34_08515 [Vagococcus penaei]|uniref:SpaA-like prealbumin fold domain-containing protein n=1 Tax=Vagococcus penaei TaxID=633807 RepID=A0A1Q2D5U1_9ENTE|nr:prealbumin-like fold domain-containing protein [Vagococcus penaei]AQP53748.1 hypothetical protein BW732_05515 [Vagococcus penaei]RSU00421.1 hypothetical protein CBF34_08515 [Vagococcus penaei]
MCRYIYCLLLIIAPIFFLGDAHLAAELPKNSVSVTVDLSENVTYFAGADFVFYPLTASQEKKIIQDKLYEVNYLSDLFIQNEKLIATNQLSLNQTGKGQVVLLTNSDIVNYLVVQTRLGELYETNQSSYERALPFLLKTPAEDWQEMLTRVPKFREYEQVPYFYKFGKIEPSSESVNLLEKPLAKAEFVLYRTKEQGQKEYLKATVANNHAVEWVQSDQPLTDSSVGKLQSDDTGLVSLRHVKLPPGEYVIQEVQAPNGYQMTQDSQQIMLIIPQEAIRDLPKILVGGYTLADLPKYVTDLAVYTRQMPRLYNLATQETLEIDEGFIERPPNKPGDSGNIDIIQTGSGQSQPLIPTDGPQKPSKKQGVFPQTNEQISIGLVAIGLVLMGIGSYIKMKRSL